MAAVFFVAFVAFWQLFSGECNPVGPYDGPGPYPFVVPATGSAISTGNALSGRSLTNSHTHTSPFGFSNSFANGLSEGYQPSSTSIANSDSGRRKRQMPLFDGSLMSAAYNPFLVDPYFRMGSGTSLSSGNALSGRADTDGRTFTDAGGNTAALSQGSSVGNQPKSLSATGSSTNSGSAQLPSVPEIPRPKRQALDYDDYVMMDPAFDFEVNGTGFGPVRLPANATVHLPINVTVRVARVDGVLNEDGVSRSLVEQSDMVAAESSKPKDILPGVLVLVTAPSSSSTATEKPAMSTGPSFTNISIVLPAQ